MARQLFLALSVIFLTIPRTLSCVLPVYLVKDACGQKGVSHKCMVWENRYILQVLLSELPTRCGCHVRLLDRQDAVDAIRALPNLEAPVMILVAVFGLKDEEEAAVKAMEQHTKDKLVIIHLNDEKYNRPHNTTWYPKVKAVYRNYHHHYDDLVEQLAYIRKALNDPTLPPVLPPGAIPRLPGRVGVPHTVPPASTVYWVPLGFGENFFTSTVMQQDIATRPLLWSWVGSVGGKLERQEMVRHMEGHEVAGKGFLHILQNYMATDMLSSMRYTDLLHQSKLIPIPRGVHWEQYRLWEALAAGGIPLALSQHTLAGLAHVPLLGFKIAWIETWEDAPAYLQRVQANSTVQAELSVWQKHNTQRYAQVLQAVASQMAQTVCGASAGTQ